MAREGKKSFFELQRDTIVRVSVAEDGRVDGTKENDSRNPETVVQSSEKNGLQKHNDNDLNALDYEAEFVLIEPEMRSNDSSVKKNKCENGKDKSADDIDLETKKDSKSKNSDLSNQSKQRIHRSRKSESRSNSRERSHYKRDERQKTISTRRRYSPYRGNDRTGYRSYRGRRSHSRSTSRSHRRRRQDSRYVEVNPK